MQNLDMCGESLTATNFCRIWEAARKVAPPRFMTAKMHPTIYEKIEGHACVPLSIQLGPTHGPLGKQIWRVNCVRPMMSVSDGIAIVKDITVDPHKIIFQVHGIDELIVENIGYVAAKITAGSE